MALNPIDRLFAAVVREHEKVRLQRQSADRQRRFGSPPGPTHLYVTPRAFNEIVHNARNPRYRIDRRKAPMGQRFAALAHRRAGGTHHLYMDGLRVMPAGPFDDAVMRFALGSEKQPRPDEWHPVPCAP